MRFTMGALLGAIVLLPQAPPAPDPLPLNLDAFAINMSNVGRRGTGLVHMTVERWSTDEERDKLRDALAEKGSDALMKALKSLPRAGSISSPGSLGWTILYAREHALATGGKKIILATDRPMQFWEITSGSRSVDYDFMLAEIRIGPDGKGEGKLATMAKITYNKDQRAVEIENYGTQPVLLSEVHTTK